MTNFDYIKTLSPESMALFLATVDDNEWRWTYVEWIKWLYEETKVDFSNFD